MSVAGPSVADRDTLGQEHPLTGSCKDEIVQLPPGIEIGPWGIDTISYSWRPQSERLWDHLELPLERGCLLQGWDPETYELEASSEVMRGAGGRVLVTEPIGGGRVGYYPRHRMIFIEGRLAALYAGDAHATGLAPPSKLVSTSYLAALNVSTLLYPDTIVFEESFIRRIDLACDISFMDGAQGVRFLRALAVLDLPRMNADAWRKDGRNETINFRNGKRIRVRAYDKGVESKSAAPGERVRVEQQIRFVGAKQPAPARMSQADLGRMWQGALKALEAADDVVVADLNGMQRVIVNAVNEGTLSAYTAERLLGHLLLRGRGMTKEWWTAQGKPHLWGRRSRELRDLGLILDENGLGREEEEAKLPLGTILHAARLAWPPAKQEEAC